MSTRSAIIARIGDQYKGIYCHHDGYLGRTGKYLLLYHDTLEKASALIALGDLSGIREHEADAYHRDHGEELSIISAPTWQEVTDDIGHDGYVYIFHDDHWEVSINDEQPVHLDTMITTTIKELLSIQEAQVENHCQQYPHLATEFRRRVSARTKKHPRTDVEVKVAYAEIPRGGNLEAIMTKLIQDECSLGAELLDLDDAALQKRLQAIDAQVGRPVPAPDPATVAYQSMKHYLSPDQWSVIGGLRRGEEGEFFDGKMIECHALIKAMPKIGETDGAPGRAALAQLHYFHRGADWFICEINDHEEATVDGGLARLAYGWANLFSGDPTTGEYGYVDLNEILRGGAELDLHWTPIDIKEAVAGYKRQHENPDVL